MAIWWVLGEFRVVYFNILVVYGGFFIGYKVDCTTFGALVLCN
jgi:hypothetical protein